MEKYRVTLVPEERAALEKLVSSGKSASRKLTHARILLLADGVRGEGYADDEIVSALGTSLKTIARVRKRFVVEGLEAAIDHRPQPPRPDKIKIKGNLEQKLIQLACSDPPRGRCHWTLQLLADEMVVLGLVDSISTETVRQALKKTTFSPGSSDMVHSAQGQRRVRLADGRRDPDLPAAVRSAYPVVCFDEACKQLFGEVRPRQPARSGSPAIVDYEYERKGVCCQLMMCEPLRGWRHVTVTERRTRRDYAHCMRELGGPRLPSGQEDSLGARQPEHARRSEPVRDLPARGGASDLGQDRVPLHAQARQLGEHGRNRDQHHEPPMPRSSAGQSKSDGRGSGGLGKGSQRQEGTYPLDLYPGRCSAETP